MGFGQGKRAGELHEVEARLKEGSARADWVCSGGSAVGSELAGIRGEAAACSGFWGQGNGKRMRGSARRDFCSAHACERRERRPLQRARHCGGEVAAARAALGSAERVARQGGSSARQRAVEKVGSDAWVPARSRRWPGWPSTARSVLNSGGGRRSRQASWRRGEKDLNTISKNSRDPTVNLR